MLQKLLAQAIEKMSTFQRFRLPVLVRTSTGICVNFYKKQIQNQQATKEEKKKVLR